MLANEFQRVIVNIPDIWRHGFLKGLRTSMFLYESQNIDRAITMIYDASANEEEGE